MECVFCRIVSGDIKSDILYEDDHVVAFRDISPEAPVHVLIVTRKHIDSAAVLGDDDPDIAGRMVMVANRLAREAGVSASGYRLVVNSGPDGGQEVPHLHLHLLGGRKLKAMG